MTPHISLEALRLGREVLHGVSLLLGTRSVGATTWQMDVYRDDRVVSLTRSTIVIERVRPDGTMSGHRGSFDLLTGQSRPRNGVEMAIHPAHLRLLQGLLGVDVDAKEAA